MLMIKIKALFVIKNNKKFHAKYCRRVKSLNKWKCLCVASELFYFKNCFKQNGDVNLALKGFLQTRELQICLQHCIAFEKYLRWFE